MAIDTYKTHFTDVDDIDGCMETARKDIVDLYGTTDGFIISTKSSPMFTAYVGTTVAHKRVPGRFKVTVTAKRKK